MSLKNERQSPGFRRMQGRLGPDAAEKLRLDTVRLQEAALNSIRKNQAICCKCGKKLDGMVPSDATDVTCFKCSESR